MNTFETRQDIYHWQEKLSTFIKELDDLAMITCDEPNISVSEHNELCKAIIHLEHFKEAFDELEERKSKGNFHIETE
jgi:hypothetical protein